ncbi:MAG: hypothetical protein KAS72_13390 [Phycisphaerales bacterium]|nr:hypothetical protein [Phycisphaerales bacterium]
MWCKALAIVTVLAVGAFVGALVLLNPSAAAQQPTRGECEGDVDGDGDTDLTDLGILLPAYGSLPGDPNWDPRADLDGDGDVLASDLSMIMASWGCPDGDPSCDGEPVSALAFDVASVDNSSVGPGDDPLNPEFNGGVTHFTFDLQVSITGDNDWTAAQATFVLMEPAIVFFEHFYGQDGPHDIVFFESWPALEFDSFYTIPDDFPNSSSGSTPLLMPNLIGEPAFRDATWGDTWVGGAGIRTIARYTIIIPDHNPVRPNVVPAGSGGAAPILGTLIGVATSRDTLGDCNEFAFDLIVGRCMGDLDGDYDIDQSDLGMLLVDYGCTGAPCPGDCDNDGDTDQSDLGILLAYYGQSCP